ncbi:MAG: TRAP transporter permease [Reyranellaceae bacterium]
MQEFVQATDLGARVPAGPVGRLLTAIAITWSLFQVWYASPLPFVFGVFVLNDTEARSIHLGFALFLAFTAYPALKRSPRDRIPLQDWVLAFIGAFCGAYLYLFYVELSTRPSQPTTLDLITAAAGIVLLLEATRRSLGLPMVVISCAFIAYTFAGPLMPEVIQHKGASVTKLLNHQWLTTEGVFGVALGVSTSFVFLFVLFGAMLDKAGAGDWMLRLSLALLGHLRGGPAKVAVVSSALNGVVSGSSISNVVSGGIFTIKLMKRTGLSGVKAGAIETASSINGQIMPPVMGAAAFLMVEYVGIPYSEIVKHAALPAIISYIALFYIVHIEALKLDTPLLKRTLRRPVAERMLRWGLGLSGTVAFCAILYYGILGAEALFGDYASWIVAAAGIGAYVGMLAYSAQFPDPEPEDPDKPAIHLPETWEAARSGLQFVLPLVVLLWCLMVDQLSPGLSAFWGTVTIAAILVTQRPLIALFRRQRDLLTPLLRGFVELLESLALGARNMISLGVATATAGIVVGTITLTGMGLMMTEFVELISGGSIILMLIFTAMISLVLGMGIPTTANYILVATLMAPVVVELGAQAGLAIPLIAVHLFVFYFGIMADVTPPVGLAAYAAAAISGEDPIKTALQGSIYSLRTALLPFVFIFSPQILLIDVHSLFELAVIAGAAILAMMAFSAATMNFMLVRNRWYETVLLLLACFTLLRPDYWLDFVYPRYDQRPPSALYQVVDATPDNGRVMLVLEGIDLNGDDVTKTVSLNLGKPGPARERLTAAGLQVVGAGEELRVGNVRFGSAAKRVGMEPGYRIAAIDVPAADRPSALWLHIPALLLLAGIYLLQKARRERGRGLAASRA